MRTCSNFVTSSDLIIARGGARGAIASALARHPPPSFGRGGFVCFFGARANLRDSTFRNDEGPAASLRYRASIDSALRNIFWEHPAIGKCAPRLAFAYRALLDDV